MPRMSNGTAWDEYFASVGEPLRDIVDDFASLGQNCEFAFVQQCNGFTDVNLLSWAQADGPGAVARLLAGGFSGLYTRDRLEPIGGGALLRDRHYGVAFHSKMMVRRDGHRFVPTPEAERDAIYADDLSKLQYLAVKTQRHLCESRRIWVFKCQGPVNFTEILELHGALAAFGPNRLLIVEADPTRPPGVEMLDQGLYLGHVRAYSPIQEAWRFNPEDWATLLRATWRMAGPAR